MTTAKYSWRIGSLRNTGSESTNVMAALGALMATVLLIGACGEPQVPVARSVTTAVVTSTAIPEPTPTPTPTPLPTPTPDPAISPAATPVPQPGLTDDTITLAVIADDDTGGTADHLFRDAWTGMLAWSKAVNDSGGIGGRTVEIVTIDSHLHDHEPKLAEVCEGDYFALVGSQSWNDYAGAEMLGTPECPIADFPADVHGAWRAESPVTFLANPFLNNIRQAGPARWLAEEYPDASQKVALFYPGDLELNDETERLREMLTGVGMDVIGIPMSLEEDPAERAQRWDDFQAEAIVWNADPGRLIAFLEALEEPPAFVLCESTCYSEEFITAGGAAVEEVITWIAHNPYGSPLEAEELLDYRYWLKETNPDVGWSIVSLQAWNAGRLFEHAFRQLLVAEPDAPTREMLINTARAIDTYTANGLYPLTNPAEGEPTECVAVMVVRNGRWVQEYPQPPRDRDCAPDNLYTLVSSRSLGLDEPDPEAASEAEPAAVQDEEDPSDLESPEEIPD